MGTISETLPWSLFCGSSGDNIENSPPDQYDITPNRHGQSEKDLMSISNRSQGTSVALIVSEESQSCSEEEALITVRPNNFASARRNLTWSKSIRHL